MSDGFIDGKPIYQAVFYDEDGTELGSEYIVPSEHRTTMQNFATVGYDMLGSPNAASQEIGAKMLTNLKYSPAIQNAGIYTNSTGEFEGLTFNDSTIKYERTSSGSFRLYIEGEDGKKDYFTTGDPDNPEIIEAANEAEIKRILLASGV